MSGAVQVEQVRDLIQRLRSPAQMFYEYSADDGAQLRASAATLEALLSELATAQREREEAYEACARICEKQQAIFASPKYAAGQPMSSFGERFACGKCAEEIRQAKGGTNAD